ncbi:antitoxin Xre/MbcA/ParS toxin-binding domain-containing protein [Rubritalea squalenifaciens]
MVHDPAEVRTWLKEHNDAFEDTTPAQVIERGEADRIWRMIHLLESGQPG